MNISLYITTTNSLSLSLLYCQSWRRSSWSLPTVDEAKKNRGYSVWFKRIFVGNPMASQ